MTSVNPPASDRLRRLQTDGHRYAFEQALWLLERTWPDAPAPGAAADGADAAVRIRPGASRAFPPTDIAQIEPDPSEAARMLVTVRFHGLYGIDARLPPRFVEALSGDRAASDPHRDFLDVFNHRFYSFFYRAWKKYRPQLRVQGTGRDVHSRRVRALAGLGETHARDDETTPLLRVAAQVRLLGRRPRHSAGLAALIRTFFGHLAVEVTENVPRWVSIPSRTRLGEGVRLGHGDPIGREVFDRSGKFRIHLGPMGRAQYQALLPGGDEAATLHRIVRLYAPDHLAYDVELNVSSEDQPPTSLGEGATQLGYTTRLGRGEHPVRTRVVEYE